MIDDSVGGRGGGEGEGFGHKNKGESFTSNETCADSSFSGGASVIVRAVEGQWRNEAHVDRSID